MKIRRRRRDENRDEYNNGMTSMIDVVFLLLVFFIVTLRQEDILAHLDVSRPDAPPIQDDVRIDLVDIQVYKHGWVMNRQRVSKVNLNGYLKELAEMDTDVPIVIRCTADSPHRHLVELLDLCAKHDLNNLSVFSM